MYGSAVAVGAIGWGFLQVDRVERPEPEAPVRGYRDISKAGGKHLPKQQPNKLQITDHMKTIQMPKVGRMAL